MPDQNRSLSQGVLQLREFARDSLAERLGQRPPHPKAGARAEERGRVHDCKAERKPARRAGGARGVCSPAHRLQRAAVRTEAQPARARAGAMEERITRQSSAVRRGALKVASSASPDDSGQCPKREPAPNTSRLNMGSGKQPDATITSAYAGGPNGPSDATAASSRASFSPAAARPTIAGAGGRGSTPMMPR